jgi:peptidyl-prolyl cis-trans isomerase B (cyclophilin B)
VIHRRTVSTALTLAAFALLAAGCGSGSGGSTTGSPPNVPLNASGCAKPPPLQTKKQTYAHEPALTIAKTTYTARIVTNCGTIMVALDGKDAPRTVNSFAFLAGKGFFTDTPCFRLTTAASGISVLQCGDPSGTGTGDPGYSLPDENLAGATYPAGTLAMANTGSPHTGGSQFFFVYANTPLPPTYTPFGHVTAGLGVLTNIAKAGSAPPGDGQPKQPVVIESFAVTKSGTG